MEPFSLRSTPAQERAARLLLQKDIGSQAERAQLRAFLESKRCSVEDLALLCVLWRSASDNSKGLHRVLRGTSWLRFPRVPDAAPPDAALVERRRYLQARQEQREYARMTRSVSSTARTTLWGGVAKETKGPMRQAAMAINMVVAVFVAFFTADYLSRRSELDDGLRLAVSLTAAITLLMVEMVLFILRSTRAESWEHEHRKLSRSHFFSGSRSKFSSNRRRQPERSGSAALPRVAESRAKVAKDKDV